MEIDPRRIEVVDDRVAEILRRMTPQARLRQAFDMWAAVRRMLTHHLSATHPEWAPEEVQREVARRMSGTG